MTELLLIEADPTLLELIATALEFEGFRVHRAADGAALLGGPEAAVDIEGDLREPAAESRSQLVAGLGSVEPLAALRTEEYTVGAQSGSATR